MRGEGPDSLRHQAFRVLPLSLRAMARGVVAIAGRLDQVSTFKTSEPGSNSDYYYQVLRSYQCPALSLHAFI
jgi:hypothetical protein